ncbi:DUF1311 domain-containing protein [Paraburkholderia sp. 1N]|uniref:DUF1311 domain-containing protein n=1 Tax=Paraburkholderia solitsugae TaxID=2675748 RepID=A0ABX2BVF0_9BURK|nr:lysozyme inhibitor LprI family protein [Paraburkholderia solitsugae]NPT44624.1 DUF1311 domain-containing protein [Paraburkholderia solitsugae]
MKRMPILAMSFLILSIHAHAETIDCKNASDQASLNQCADLDYQAADKKLNETYSKLLKKVSPQGKPRLQKAERAWVTYRDAQCEFLTSSPTPYSAQPMIHSYCLSRLTEAQTKLLDEQLHCAEGVIGCGQQ